MAQVTRPGRNPENDWADIGPKRLGRSRPNIFSFSFWGGPDPNGSAQAHMVAGSTQQPCKVIMLHAEREFVLHAAT